MTIQATTAPAAAVVPKPTAAELMTLVREAAAILAERGAAAYAELRKPGTRWRHDETYLFVLTMAGRAMFHAVDPTMEGRDISGMTDIRGRPFGRMFLEVAGAAPGEGWVHYLYPLPGSPEVAWKSAFVKRVVFPDGTPHLVGCGIYQMPMEKAFIEDMVDRAATLVAERGPDAFGLLRDRTGPFVFMDTYVFVERTDGVELVNPAQPAMEGMNLLDIRDQRGKAVVQEEIAAALERGTAWLECYWNKPGDIVPSRKLTYVRLVESGGVKYIVGSGIYVP